MHQIIYSSREILIITAIYEVKVYDQDCDAEMIYFHQ